MSTIALFFKMCLAASEPGLYQECEVISGAEYVKMSRNFYAKAEGQDYTKTLNQLATSIYGRPASTPEEKCEIEGSLVMAVLESLNTNVIIEDYGCYSSKFLAEVELNSKS